ncbi:hypothetical protein [Cellulophaga sp. Hel_I_12]|uniref:hypothetical protein n=1 Tax=Cellulophaga sp. Hel_I_12 TaxID=1249972 RepID=UPI0018CDD7ED|nr:hypothetical protein [Cellulophaga sp. Hel_I_12]
MMYLKHFGLNIFTGFFLILLCTSYLPKEGVIDYEIQSKQMNVSGSFNHEVLGDLSFSESTEVNTKGVPYVSLTLKLENESENKVAILISEENTNEPINEGSYHIATDTSKSQHYSNGVFAYYNNIASNELPFFTEKGLVVITNRSNKLVEGYLNLDLRNVQDKKITVSGKFRATKKLH